MANPVAPAKSAAPNAKPVADKKAGGARPGTTDKKAEKKAKRVTYGPIPEGGLTAIPTDFDSKKHKPLVRKDFANEADFYELRATMLEKMAARMREQAKIIRTTGGRKELQKVNRLRKMQDKMAELRAQLAEQGLDIDAMLAATANGDGTKTV